MADREPTTRFTRTATVGGGGGAPFEIQKAGQLVKRLEITWESDRLRGIAITLFDGTSHTAGRLSGASTGTFEFQFGEAVQEVTLWKSDYRGGRCAGMRFKTNKGRSFTAGPCAGSASQLSGGYIGGLFGKCGADIDQLGFSYANDVSGYYLQDVKYDMVKANTSGVVPTNLDTGVLINSSRATQKMSYNKSVSVAQTKSWSSQFSIKAGVKVSGEAGVPLVASGKVEVSAEAGFAYTWGGSETWTSSQTVQAGPIDVEPGKMYRVAARVESGNISVPYTGTAILTYDDGTSIKQPETGEFRGITVGLVQMEVTGPFDADPVLGQLGAGQHEVALPDPAHPELRLHTVVVM